MQTNFNKNGMRNHKMNYTRKDFEFNGDWRRAQAASEVIGDLARHNPRIPGIIGSVLMPNELGMVRVDMALETPSEPSYEAHVMEIEGEYHG